jgi:O-antigen/teichoic acid export membrane protein
MSEPQHGVATRTLRGMAWAYGAYVGGRILWLVATAILARLLTPTDFGVVALALVFMTFLDSVKDLGLGQALIVASPEEEADRAQTVFSWSVVIGVTLSSLTAASGPAMDHFFHQSQLVGLMPVLGASFFIRSLGTTHYALARKHLKYQVRTASEIAEVTIRGVISIGLALAGFGPWALAIGFISGATASTIVLWARVPFRPQRRLSRTHLKDLMRFGGILTVVDIGAVMIYNLDYVFTGRILGTYALGLYTIGFRLPELAILNVANVASDVLFPAFSALDRKRLQEAYLIGLRYITMLTLPIALAIVVLARPITLVVFGPDWVGSIHVMQLIAAYTFCATIAIPSGTIFKVTRQAWIMIAFTIPGIVVLIVLLSIFTKQGIIAVALSMTVIQGVALPLSLWVAARRLELPLTAGLRVMVPTVVAAGAMAAVVFGVDLAIPFPFLSLLVGIPAGIAIYLGTLFLIARESLWRLREMAFPNRGATAVG